MEHWNHILTLLSFSIIIDDRVYKEEVDCFVEQALKVRERLNSDMLFSKKMVFDWFVAHRDEKQKQLKSDKRELYILEPIIALSNVKGKDHILAAMSEISHSDGEYHDKELDLIALARAQWGL